MQEETALYGIYESLTCMKLISNEGQQCQHLWNINEEVYQYFWSISKQDLVDMHKYIYRNTRAW